MQSGTTTTDSAPASQFSDVAAGLERIRRTRTEVLDAYETHGFAIVKNVFSLDEVLAMRKTCAELHERTQGKHGEIASYPELRRILLDDRIVAIGRAVFGDLLTYFGDSTFYANSRFDRHLHSDARGDIDDPSRSSFPILRMGVYLQDHAHFSNGLKVRPGSHKSAFWTARNALRLFGVGGSRLSLRAFRPRWFYNVPSEPGDVIFWNLRMHHAAHAIRLRGTDLALPPQVEEVLPARFARPMTKDRYAIFMSWGAESRQLDAYIRQLAYHPGYIPTIKMSTFGDAASREDFERKGVRLKTDMLKLAQLAG